MKLMSNVIVTVFFTLLGARACISNALALEVKPVTPAVHQVTTATACTMYRDAFRKATDANTSKEDRKYYSKLERNVKKAFDDAKVDMFLACEDAWYR